MNYPPPIFFSYESSCLSILSLEERRSLEALLGANAASHHTIEEIWATCLRPDLFSEFQKNRSALTRPGDVHREVYELKRVSDGALRHILICETLKEDANFQGVVVDISEWVENANNATAAAAEATHQLASFGHDLRQPLQILTGYLDMLGEGPNSGTGDVAEYLEQRASSLDMCVRTVRKLDDLITGMLGTGSHAHGASSAVEAAPQEEVDLFAFTKQRRQRDLLSGFVGIWRLPVASAWRLSAFCGILLRTPSSTPLKGRF
jgi:signal transduction histidine kinase